jgi:hypothetical protein
MRYLDWIHAAAVPLPTGVRAARDSSPQGFSPLGSGAAILELPGPGAVKLPHVRYRGSRLALAMTGMGAKQSQRSMLWLFDNPWLG